MWNSEHWTCLITLVLPPVNPALQAEPCLDPAAGTCITTTSKSDLLDPAESADARHLAGHTPLNFCTSMPWPKLQLEGHHVRMIPAAACSSCGDLTSRTHPQHTCGAFPGPHSALAWPRGHMYNQRLTQRHPRMVHYGCPMTTHTSGGWPQHRCC